MFIAAVELLSRNISTKDILRKLLYADERRMGRTADRMERYVQQTCAESKFGEYRGNVGGELTRRKELERHLDGKKLKQTDNFVYPGGGSDMRGWQFGSLNKEHIFGIWLRSRRKMNRVV